jgi:lysozyme family protein
MQNVPSTFEACLAFVWQSNNDGRADNSASSEDWLTKWGVTAETWQLARQQGIVADKDISAATQDDCSNILRVMYWNSLHCSQLSAGINLMMFNDGMVCGVGYAARLLQRIIGVDQDGVVGPETIRRACSYGDKELIDALVVADDEYYASLATASLYLNGWTRREVQAKQSAYRMAGINSS